ncbi:MAG: SDR family NAD(P)-dependent oxidoreductase [Alphaproteobacteria bacterium]|nr:SDR family NAD(P)-dependent oxidoreductase [Alphaproteobacteria bacterium]
MDLRDLPFVVTGGAGALGAAVVARLLDEGALVHLPLRDARATDHLPWAGHPALRITVGIELTDEDAVTRYYAALPALWASLQLAGGFASAKFTDITAADLERVLASNLRTAFLCSREAVRAMRAHPAPGRRGGRIVNVTAKPALEPRAGAGMVAYAAAKAAVAAMTVALAEEVAGEGILANAVAPSIIDSAANRLAMPQADWAAWPKPAEIAEAILFLASPLNRAARSGVIPLYGRG